MTSSDETSGRTPGIFRLVIAAVAVLLPQASEAGLTLTSSSVQVGDTLNAINPAGPGYPVFGGGGILVSPGGGLPTTLFTVPPVPGTFQIATAPTLAPPFAFTSSTTPRPGVIGTVPAKFGTAVTAVFAQGAGQQGTLLTQGGLFYDTRTRLADNLGPGDVNLASVSYSFSTATFRNDTGADILLNPAALLSVQGNVGTTNDSYVAAGLLASITLSDSTIPINLEPIVLAATRPNIAFGIAGRNDPISAINIGGRLFATATSTYGSIVAVHRGQSITIQSSLTLISDPGSSIQVVSSLAPLPPGFQFHQPDFGVYVGGTFSQFVVPEPSAIAMLGLGLATAGGWRLRARGRRRVRA